MQMGYPIERKGKKLSFDLKTHRVHSTVEHEERHHDARHVGVQRYHGVERAVVPRARPQDQPHHGQPVARPQDDRPHLVHVEVLGLPLAAALLPPYRLPQGHAVHDDGHGKVVGDANVALEPALRPLRLPGGCSTVQFLISICVSAF